MQLPLFPSHPDRLLRAFLQAADGRESRRLLERLVDAHVRPVVREVIARRWRVAGTAGSLEAQEAQDLRDSALAHIVARLEALRQAPDGEPVRDLRAYAAATAQRACDTYLRRKYPQRRRLINRLRYLLTHHPDFALWQEEGRGWRCGLAGRPGRHPTGAARMEQLHAEPRSLLVSLLGRDEPAQAPLETLVGVLLRWLGQPLDLEDLTTAIATATGIDDRPPIGGEGEETDEARYERAPDPSQDVAAEVNDRLFSQQLWDEVCLLPAPQRAALLLNLRDAQGRGVVALLPLQNVASLRQIAGALEMPPEELAALWNDLPLEDGAIAARLGLTRQQVINLRKAARQRLWRRMQPWRDEAAK